MQNVIRKCANLNKWYNSAASSRCPPCYRLLIEFVVPGMDDVLWRHRFRKNSTSPIIGTPLFNSRHILYGWLVFYLVGFVTEWYVWWLFFSRNLYVSLSSIKPGQWGALIDAGCEMSCLIPISFFYMMPTACIFDNRFSLSMFWLVTKRNGQNLS